MSIFDKATMMKVLQEHEIADPRGFLAALPGYASVYELALSHHIDAATGKQSFKLCAPAHDKSVVFPVGGDVDAMNDDLFELLKACA